MCKLVSGPYSMLGCSASCQLNRRLLIPCLAGTSRTSLQGFLYPLCFLGCLFSPSSSYNLSSILMYDIYVTWRVFVIYISAYFSATFIFLPQSFIELFLLDCLNASTPRWKVAFAQLRSKAFASKTCWWCGWNSPFHQSSNDDTLTHLEQIKLSTSMITHNGMLKMEWGWVGGSQ